MVSSNQQSSTSGVGGGVSSIFILFSTCWTTMLTKLLVFIFLIPFAVVLAQPNCRDDPSYTWSYRGGGRVVYTRHCNYLTNSEKTMTNELRQRDNCDRNNADGVLVKEGCRASCNNCRSDDNNNPIVPDSTKCYNSPFNWVSDRDGTSCYFYNWNVNKCYTREFTPGTNGKTPQQACCACGGGCRDYKNWRDSRNYGCEFYGRNLYVMERRCTNAWRYKNRDGIDATAACCFCEGGLDSAAFSSMDEDNLKDNLIVTAEDE